MKDTIIEGRTCQKCQRIFVSAHGLNVHHYLAHTTKGKRQNTRPRAKRKLTFAQLNTEALRGAGKATPLPNRKNETAAPHPNFCPRCGEALTDEGRRTQRALGMLKGVS